MSDERALQTQVEAAVRRLRAMLPARVGPRAARDVLAALARAAELGAPLATQLASLTSTIDAFSQRPPIAAPWSSAMCRAIATVAPKKLAHAALLARRPRTFPDVLVRAVADHAQALVPSFGDDGDFSLAVAWHNVLTYHCALVGGECHNRNSAAPVLDLAAACADAGLADDDVPVCLLRGVGVVIARGYVPPREDAPFRCRALSVHLWGQGRVELGVVGDGCFDGVRWLIEDVLALPFDVAHLPLWLTLATLPCDPTAVIDDGDALDALADVEDRLEQRRLAGAAPSIAARLGVADDDPPLSALTLRVGDVRLTLSAARLDLA